MIIRYVCMLTVLITLSSCIYDYDDTGQDAGELTTYVNLTIVMSDVQTGTRAGTWGDDDYQKEEATAWEKAIESRRLQVLVFDTDNKYICQIENIFPVKTADNEYSVIGSLTLGNYPLADGKLSCKFVVIANCDNEVSLDLGQDMSAMESVSYQYDPSAIAAKTACIPMWGVKAFTGDEALSLVANGTTQAGAVYMLRGMSKIRIRLSDDIADDFTLVAATISDYNTTGYVMPSGFSEVSDTRNLFYTGSGSPQSFHPNLSKAGKALAFQTEWSGKRFVLYLPECATNTSSTGVTDPYLTIAIAPKASPTETEIYQLNLRQYTNGVESEDNLNLIRNTIYDYMITKVAMTIALKRQTISTK